MKTFFVILTFCLAGVLADLTPEEKVKMDEALEAACIKESGIDRVRLENIGEVEESDEKLACFMACTMKGIGMMNADGTINEEVYEVKSRVRGSIPKDKVTEIRNKCKSMKGNNACQTAMKVSLCLHQEDNKF